MLQRRIRLTYLITDLNVGGVPLHLYRLATRLPAERFDIHVISLADVGPVGDRLREKGFRVSACGAECVYDVRALARLWWLLWEDSPDVLHSLLFHANIAARFIGLMTGIPARRIICEIQTAERDRLWHLAVDNATCRMCRVEVGNSLSVIEHLIEKGGIPSGRLLHMPGGVDVDAFAGAAPADRKRLSVPEDAPLVIWTGRLDPVKGFEEMLGAFRRVRSSPPPHLLLVGEGPYRPVIEKLINQHDLKGRVRLLGRRDDVPSLLAAADAFLFCSRTEGLPNALLEAMAAGLPIVTTDAPGCRDLISHGHTGLMAPVRDAVRIADGLQSLLDDPNGARSLGQAARRWVRDNFGLESMIQLWVEFYRSL